VTDSLGAVAQEKKRSKKREKWENAQSHRKHNSPGLEKKMNRQEEWADELRADGYKGVSKDTTK